MKKQFLVAGLALITGPLVWGGLTIEGAAAPRLSVTRERLSASPHALIQAREAETATLPASIEETEPPAPRKSTSAPAGVVLVDAYREVDGKVMQMSGAGVLATRLGHVYVPLFVVRKAESVIVAFPGGERVPARMVGGDQESQLAILKISSVPENVTTPDLCEPAAERAGRAVRMVQADSKGVRAVTGKLLGEQAEVGPLRNVLEVSIPKGSVSGGILLDEKGALVGLALATAEGERPQDRTVLALPASRIKAAVDRMVRGEPGTEAPRQVNLTEA